MSYLLNSLQDFEAITPNILARTIETVSGQLAHNNFNIHLSIFLSTLSCMNTSLKCRVCF